MAYTALRRHSWGIAAIIDNCNTGYIVPKNDAETLAERIAHLIDTPQERVAMGRNGRENFKREFTLGRFEEKLLEVIKENIKIVK